MECDSRYREIGPYNAAMEFVAFLTRRTRELGIRIALGASTKDIIELFASEARRNDRARHVDRHPHRAHPPLRIAPQQALRIE